MVILEIHSVTLIVEEDASRIHGIRAVNTLPIPQILDIYTLYVVLILVRVRTVIVIQITINIC